MIQHQLETWLGNARIHERTVPRFVERELRAFLDCGILANGFLRLHCEAPRPTDLRTRPANQAQETGKTRVAILEDPAR